MSRIRDVLKDRYYSWEEAKVLMSRTNLEIIVPGDDVESVSPPVTYTYPHKTLISCSMIGLKPTRGGAHLVMWMNPQQKGSKQQNFPIQPLLLNEASIEDQIRRLRVFKFQIFSQRLSHGPVPICGPREPQMHCEPGCIAKRCSLCGDFGMHLSYTRLLF